MFLVGDLNESLLTILKLSISFTDFAECFVRVPKCNCLRISVGYHDSPVIFVGPDEMRARTIAGLCWVCGCVFHLLWRGAVVSSP